MSLVITDTSPDQLMEHWDKHSSVIVTKTFEESSTEQGFVPLEFKDRYVHMTGSSTEMIQSYQQTWTEKGNVELKPRVQRHAAWKVDMSFEPRKYSTRSYLAWAALPGSNPYDLPYESWILYMAMMQKLEDLEFNTIWKGREFGVIPGAANPAQDIADGLIYKADQAGIAGEAVPWVMPTLTVANAVSEIEAFVKGNLNTPTLRKKRQNLHCSLEVIDLYQNSYRASYGRDTHANEYNHVQISGTNVFLVPHAGLTGSEFMLMTGADRLFFGYDGAVSVTIEKYKRETLILFDGEFSVDFDFAPEVYYTESM